MHASAGALWQIMEVVAHMQIALTMQISRKTVASDGSGWPNQRSVFNNTMFYLRIHTVVQARSEHTPMTRAHQGRAQYEQM